MKKISRLFGNRVALQLEEEEYEGLIVPPPTRMQMHVLSRVLAIGDEVKNIEVGDTVFYQKVVHPFGNQQQDPFNADQKRFDMNGTFVFVEMGGDMIAKMAAKLITLENFQALNDWVLCRKVVVKPSQLIIVPDSAEANNQDIMLEFHVEQVGQTVEGMQKGQEVIVDRGRANPIKIGNDEFVYIHKNFVLGVLG